MSQNPVQTFRIAAALIDDDQGRLLLVRQAGSPWFMQAGGKIEGDESAINALRREQSEEIGLSLTHGEPRYLGRFSAPAAKETHHVVEAEIFHVRTCHTSTTGFEIEEAIWVDRDDAILMPLTRSRETMCCRLPPHFERDGVVAAGNLPWKAKDRPMGRAFRWLQSLLR